MLSATVVSMSCNLLPNVIIRDIFSESTILFSGLQLRGYWPADRILDGGGMRKKRCFQVLWHACQFYFPGLKNARQPFMKSRTSFFLLSECLCLIGGRRKEGRKERIRATSCVFLSKNDTSSILSIFVAPAPNV